jgi:hypothetical protein
MNWKAQNIISKEIGISRTSLYLLAKNGIIEKRYIGKKVLFDYDVLQELINKNALTDFKLNQKKVA